MKKNSPVRRTPALKSQPAKPVEAVKVDAVKVEAVKPVEVTKAVEKAVEAVQPVVAAIPVAPVVVAAFPAETVEKLQDASVEVAVEAAETLAKSGDVRVVPALVSVLVNADGYCHVVTRAAAAMALGHFNDETAIVALIAAATGDSAEVSCEAILALGQLKATAAVATLTEIAANASGFYLTVSRHAAVRSLGRMKALSAKAVLSAIAESPSEDAALVAAAHEAIGQL